MSALGPTLTKKDAYMSYQRERDHFMARCQLSPETARALLRHATTLQRLAEAQCNGDWPADGPWRDRGRQDITQCPLCESWWARSQIQGGTAARLAWRNIKVGDETWTQGKPQDERACPDCRTEARVHALLEGTQWQAWTQGDPRGYVLRLFPRRVPGCTGCAGKANREDGTVYHQKGCGGPQDGNTMVNVEHDDMYCGRVDSLGVPTR